MARKTSDEVTSAEPPIITPAQADAAEVYVPSSRKTGPSTWAKGVSRIKSGAFFEGRKNNYGGNLDPTAADDQTQGYGIGSIFFRSAGTIKGWLASTVATGAAMWHRLVFWDDLSPGAFSGLLADMDPPPGTMVTQDATAYPTFDKQEVQVIDCAGNLNKARVSINGKTLPVGAVGKWKNNPGGQKPNFAQAGDEWDGPVLGGRLVYPLLGTSLTLGPSLVGQDIRGLNETKAVIVFPADSVATFDVDVPFDIFRKDAVIEMRAGAGASINGVPNARLEINAVNSVARCRKDGPNSYWVEMTPFITELEAGAEVTYPLGGGNGHELVTVGDDDYYDIWVSGADIAGELVIAGVDVIADVLVVPPGASGSKGGGGSPGGGGSGGAAQQFLGVTLAVGAIPFAIQAPGAGVTTGAGLDGGTLTWDGVIYYGGKGGAQQGTAGVAGILGSGAGSRNNTSGQNLGGDGTIHDGGKSLGSPNLATRNAGGGAGAGGPGGDGDPANGKGGPGGPGLLAFDGLRYGCGGPGGGSATGAGVGDSPTGSDNWGGGSPGTNGANSAPGKVGGAKVRILASLLAAEPQAV